MFNSVMLRIAALAMVPFLAACATQGGSSSRVLTSEAPKVITLDDSYLSVSKQRLAAGDASLKPAYDALIASANKALAAKPETVTQKGMTPLSGDKHDYMSMGPYWWPNPDTPDHLPFIRKDGNINPDTKGNGLDSARIITMGNNARDLSLAYYFTGDKKYAVKAAEVLRTWFLDPATRMNPNLRFGQGIPGITDGRGIGMTDTRNLWMVIDAAALIQPSGALSADEVQGLRQWFGDFAGWMVNSATGHEEAVWHNNHGMFYDAQLINYLLFIGDIATAKQVIFDAQTRRIASQIARDGRMHMELERTRPYHYTVFALEAAMHIARYGEQVNVAGMTLKADDPHCIHPQSRCIIDVWNFEIDERSLKRGINYLTAATLDPKSWTLYSNEEKVFDANEVLPIMLQAERAYKTGTYGKVVAGLPDNTKTALDRLLWPVK
ncbi:MAG: alginate lyase [Rhodocyclales bacterium]|nr:alginate lyase [Rhodocyclales bacterium]